MSSFLSPSESDAFLILLREIFFKEELVPRFE
jgi:hypothetical protein